MELEMLSAASQRWKNLLWVCCGEDEDHVLWRLFERLQQRVRCRRREHVDLVDDVHLPASRCRERGAGDEVAHRLDTIVGYCIEFVDVERRALGDCPARFA